MFLEVLTMHESEQKIVLVQGICKKKFSPIGRPSRSNLQMHFSKGGASVLDNLLAQNWRISTFEKKFRETETL